MNNFFFVILLLSFVSFAGIVLTNLFNAIMRRRLALKFFLIPVTLFLIGFVGFGLTIEPDTNTDSASETAAAETTAVTAEEETTTQEETTVEPETEETIAEEETTIAETESEDEFKTSCQEIGYKKLLRTPDDHIGQRITITAKVQQIMEGGFFDDSKYYRVQTDNEGYDLFYDDEYFMYDSRIADDMKILDGDVLKIYGEFIGLETIKRALTGTKEEVPAVKAYYVELISE